MKGENEREETPAHRRKEEEIVWKQEKVNNKEKKIMKKENYEKESENLLWENKEEIENESKKAGEGLTGG